MMIVGVPNVGKSSLIPIQISEKAYNISMPGTSAIEQYYIIEEYIKKYNPNT